MHPHVCGLFLFFATEFSGRGKSKTLWGEQIIFFDERDTPGSEKDTVNTLLLNFGLNIKGRKGKKGGGF